MYRKIISTMLLTVSGVIWAEAPVGYYSACEGLSGQKLLEALHQVVGEHQNVGYSGLWKVYATSDVRPEDGTIEDIYSTKHWTYSKDQCGSYSGMGDCYNREHSLPKSWFKEQEPMRSDAYHIYPTDGWVNGKRSNYPYGECSGGTTWSSGSMRGLGRLGQSTFPGYSGTVFEPDDAYKGDLARSYFYMAACYNDLIDDWSSDMLAGNSYPAFTDWAVNLLLKWHRNDAVSSKEERRNEAIAEWQKNRNPFIDHPEFVEHIWGDKSTVAWHENNYSDATIVSPTPGTVIDLGLTGKNVSCSSTVDVRALGVTKSLRVSVSGNGWTCTPSVISVEDAVKGTPVTISYSGATPGEVSGSMTISSDEVSASYVLSATVADGIPALAPDEISADGFVARWINVHGKNATYTLDVTSVTDNSTPAGYPMQIAASQQSHRVTGLNPMSAYRYSLTCGNDKSNVVEVTTSALMPEITLDADKLITLSANVGEPSASVEIGLFAENVGNGFTVSVDEPFELSTDLAFWATEVELQEEDDHFYLRVNSPRAGSYSSAIRVECEKYLNDDHSVEAIVRSATWIETFELPTDWSGYASGDYDGLVAKWHVTDGNVYDDTFFNGTNVMRFGKSSTSSIELLAPKAGGIGTVSFDAATWSLKNDKAASVEIEYTVGDGAWVSVATATIANEESTPYAFTLDVKGDARIRLRQTSGARWLLDNLMLTDHPTFNAIDSPVADGRSWDAMLRGGRLVVVSYEESPLEVQIYSVDGAMVRCGSITGEISLSLPAGLYIVVAGDEARRVSVR